MDKSFGERFLCISLSPGNKNTSIFSSRSFVCEKHVEGKGFWILRELVEIFLSIDLSEMRMLFVQPFELFGGFRKSVKY